jgi:hypothetical protein
MPSFLFAAFCALILIVCAISAKRKHESFLERFPPISDAEFLARCAPGTNPDVALKVRQILAESLNVEYERIYPSSRLMADLGAE